MWIEFLGGVGSGKSSLATALKACFKSPEFTVRSPQDKAILSGRSANLVRRALFVGWQARFSLKYPNLVRQAWNASQELRNLPAWHRRMIFSLFLEVAGWYEEASYTTPPKSMVVVDEGLAHRSINLFAWQSGDLETKGIQTYLENLPAIPLTIHVCAPVQTCVERAYSRGLPVRLRGKDPETIRRFIENSHTIASLAGKILTSKGRAVIQIENTSGLEKSIALLYKQVSETVLVQNDITKSYQPSPLQTAEDET